MSESLFTLETRYTPAGDQPEAIRRMVEGLEAGLSHQTLLGVTGSGKTFSIANVIAQVQRPTMVLAPNKTLAAQLYGEFKAFFPHNAVEYFVSYYDYYQPEAYVPSSDTYIEKDASINDHIEQMRLSATKALIQRRDAIIVTTVSCIYGLGSPETYLKMVLHVDRGDRLDQRELLRRLTELQYTRNEMDFARATFRVRGDVVDIFPAESELEAVRIELFDDEVESIAAFDPLTGEVIRKLPRFTFFPKTHYATPRETLLEAVEHIKVELRDRLDYLQGKGKLVEAQRLEQRTRFDLEMIMELGYCNGIENYSRYLSGRGPGEPPPTLFDYLPADALLVIDESHVSVPQVGAMYKGDRSRKETLVEYGFRLPSALDNRPLRFDEWEAICADHFRLRHARALRGRACRPGHRAGGASHRPGRPGGGSAPGQHPGGRPAVGDQQARGGRPTRAGHHADQAHGRGPHRLPGRPQRAGALPALGHRHRRAGGDHPRPAYRRLRRAGGHQPAARGPGHARGVAGSDPRRRQGRLPAFRALADPDHRPRRAQPARQGDPLCRQHHRLHAARHRRNRAAAQQAAGLQRGARHRPTGIKKDIRDILEGAVVPGARSGKRKALKAAEEEARYDAGLRSPSEINKRIRQLEEKMMQLARDLEFEAAAQVRDEIQALRQRLLQV